MSTFSHSIKIEHSLGSKQLLSVSVLSKLHLYAFSKVTSLDILSTLLSFKIDQFNWTLFKFFTMNY